MLLITTYICVCGFRHAYFELPAGVGEPWTRDGWGIPQGCPLSMMFTVALYLPWCKYLGGQDGVQPQLYADNFNCVSCIPVVQLEAARSTAGYVRMVGQERAPEKCVLMSTFKTSRRTRRIGSSFGKGINGLLLWISVIQEVIWILPFGAGLVRLLLEFGR